MRGGLRLFSLDFGCIILVRCLVSRKRLVYDICFFNWDCFFKEVECNVSLFLNFNLKRENKFWKCDGLIFNLYLLIVYNRCNW